MTNFRRSPSSPSRRLRSSRSSRSRSRSIIFTMGSIVAFSAISLIYLTHSTVWNEALRKLDIQKKNLDQSHLPPPPPPRVDKQQQLQLRGGDSNNVMVAPKNDDEDSYPGKLYLMYLLVILHFLWYLNIMSNTSLYNANYYCTSIILHYSKHPFLILYYNI